MPKATMPTTTLTISLLAASLMTPIRSSVGLMMLDCHGWTTEIFRPAC